jgi:hypothetical protein
MAPLFIALVSALGPPLIKLAEGAITGEKKGPERKDFVVNSIGAAIDQLAKKGGANPQEFAPILKDIVEMVFQVTRGSLPAAAGEVVTIRGTLVRE